MVSQKRSDMARALLTDGERRHISGESGERQRGYEAVSRVRARVRDELTDDVELLADHHPDLLKELRDVVCGPTTAELEFEPLGPKNVSYGPSDRDGAAFVLRVGTEDGAVRIHLDEDEMYELWTEVQHTPWPDRREEDEEVGRLRNELVEKAMGADAEMLRDALDAMDPHRDER